MRIGAFANFTNSYMPGFMPDMAGAKVGAVGVGAETGTAAVGGAAGVECQTCKERKYQDGSNENVSFKSAQHISPEASASAVRAHEGEHVSNAYDKAAENGGKVLNASVSIKTAVCPECGKSYVAGGLTSTTIKYNDSDPYQSNIKSLHAANLGGQEFDKAV